MAGVSVGVVLSASLVIYFRPPYDIPRLQEKWAECPGFASIKLGDAGCRVYGNGSKTAVIWGDSHVEALIAAVTPVENYRLVVLFHNGCPPAPGVRRIDGTENARNCKDLESLRRYENYILTASPAKVFLVGRWTLYANGWWTNGRPQKANHFLADEATSPDQVDLMEKSRAAMMRSMVGLVKMLKSSADVYFITQPFDLAFLSRRQRIAAESLDRSAARDWHSAEEHLAQALSAAGAIIMDTKALFCTPTDCLLKRDDIYLYRDDNHLSPFGAKAQFDLIKSKLD